MRNISFWTLSKARFSYHNPDGIRAAKVDKDQTSSCGFVFDKTHPAQSVSTHIELKSAMDTKELLALNLNNRPWSTLFSVMKTWKKCDTHTTKWGKTYKCREKSCGVNSWERRQNSLKLKTIKSVKACDAFPFRDKIIRILRCFNIVFQRPDRYFQSLWKWFSPRLNAIKFLPVIDYRLKFVKMQVLVKSILLWQQ